MTLNFIQLPGEPKPTTPPWSLVRTPKNFRVLKSQVTQTQYVGLKPVEDLRCQVPKSLRTVIFCKSSRVPDDFDVNHDFQNCFQNLPGLYFSTCGLRTRVSSSVSLWQRGAGVSLFGLFALSFKDPGALWDLWWERLAVLCPFRFPSSRPVRDVSPDLDYQLYLLAQTAFSCLPYSEASCTAYMILLYFSEKGTILKEVSLVKCCW